MKCHRWVSGLCNVEDQACRIRFAGEQATWTCLPVELLQSWMKDLKDVEVILEKTSMRVPLACLPETMQHPRAEEVLGIITSALADASQNRILYLLVGFRVQG